MKSSSYTSSAYSVFCEFKSVQRAVDSVKELLLSHIAVWSLLKVRASNNDASLLLLGQGCVLFFDFLASLDFLNFYKNKYYISI